MREFLVPDNFNKTYVSTYNTGVMMAGINEVFPNPTVKVVVFQIRFPNLFYLESRMGDFQIKIMKEFPKSALLIKKQIIFADPNPSTNQEDLGKGIQSDPLQKIWQFENEKKITLNITNQSLDLVSEYHKTYNNSSKDENFRDTIDSVVKAFLETMGLPIINRIGIRYIDHCPIPSKETQEFNEWYNSILPLGRFPLTKAIGMDSACVIREDGINIRYSESFQQSEENENILILDFDAFAMDILSNEFLEITDKLHRRISDEYNLTIKKPVREFMRRNIEK